MDYPIIGVTTTRIPGNYGQTDLFGAAHSYLNAVTDAGGVPLLIPSSLNEAALERAFQRLDGLLLTGGGDLAPDLFQGAAHPAVYGIEPDRDRCEIALVRRAAEAELPFLGICRGVQAINVAMGGTLYTHISDQLNGACKHDYFPGYPRDQIAHAVSIQAGCRLAGILGGERFEVNSLHHQGLERVAPGLEICAHAPDGLVEAVELSGHPFGLGVQWHPEWLQAYQPQRDLFRAFVAAAGGGRGA